MGSRRRPSFAAREPSRLRRFVTATSRKQSVWVISIQILQNVVRLGSNLILTRLVAPEAFGVIGAAMTIAYVGGMISELGLTNYLLRRKSADSDYLDFIWTLRMCRDVLLGFMVFVGAGYFASLYGYREIEPTVKILALTTFIGAFSSLATITAQRDGMLIRLGLVELAGYICMVAVMLAAAIELRSYWAILIAMVFDAGFKFAASYVAFPNPRRRFRFSGQDLKELLQFSRAILPANVIRIFLSQTDKIVLIKLLALAEFGKYTLAVGIVSALHGLSSHYIMRVFIPNFARAQREGAPDISKSFYQWRMRVSLLAIAGLGAIAGGADLIVAILFPDTYQGVSFYLRFLSLGSVATLLTLTAENVLVARGFPATFLWANLVRLAWLAAACPVGYQIAGARGVFLAVCMMEGMAAPYLWWKLRREGLFDAPREALLIAAVVPGYGAGVLAAWGAKSLQAAGILPGW